MSNEQSWQKSIEQVSDDSALVGIPHQVLQGISLGSAGYQLQAGLHDLLLAVAQTPHCSPTQKQQWERHASYKHA